MVPFAKMEKLRFGSDADTSSYYQTTFPICSLSSASICPSLPIIPGSKQVHNSISPITPTPSTSLAEQDLAPTDCISHAHRSVGFCWVWPMRENGERLEDKRSENIGCF